MAMQRKRRRRSGGNNNNNNSPNPNRHYESNGPDVRIRGSAQQILDKYLQYARDAQTSGDRVKAEALFQHAEHYARIVAVFEKQKEEARIEREARDAARAEERAQRDAERTSHEETATSLDEAADTPQDGMDVTAEGANEPKPRRRSRRPREDASADPSGAIEGDGADASEVVSAAAEIDEKPKRRRSPARKKPAESDAAEESDGVMKTLARGADEIVAEAE